MIASLTGRVAAAGPDGAVIDIGGVGLTVQCTPGTIATLRVGEEARLATSLVVREDSLTLYGFASTDERLVFELLQTASGVGPRLALAVLAVHPPDALRRAVAGGDVGALTQVPGIGRKGAQRILLELRDRLGAPEDAETLGATVNGRVVPPAWREQVHAGLINLGWSTREVEDAVSAVTPEADAAIAGGQPPDVSALLRSALQRLSQ